MFDSVRFEMACPACGETVDGFQSKDGANTLATLAPHEVRNFYSSCSKCNLWINCEYVPPAGKGKIIATAVRNGQPCVVEVEY